MTLGFCLHLTISVVEATGTLGFRSLDQNVIFSQAVTPLAKLLNYMSLFSNHFQASLSSEDGAFCSADGLSTCLTPQSDTRNRTLNLPGIKQCQHAYRPDHSQLDLQTTAVTDRAENEL